MTSWKLYEGKEERFQMTCYDMIASRNLLGFHIANERTTKTYGKKNVSIEGGKLKKMGVRKGVVDIIILEPMGAYHGMVIELKANRQGKATPEQMEFLFKAHERGYFSLLTWSLDEYLYYLDKYFQLGRGEKIVPLGLPYKMLDDTLLQVNWNRLNLYKEKSP